MIDTIRDKMPFGKRFTRTLPQHYLLHRRYVIEQLLGEGGFGITYQAWDRQMNCRVAVKEYMPQGLAVREGESGTVLAVKDPAHFEKYLDRFLEEAQIIYRYRNHPNIVSVRHLFRENNTAYYAMEYLDGSDLRHQLLNSPGHRMGWEGLKPIFAQTVTALGTVHKSGIIHCDVSPDNIILREGGQVKLIDFGAAKSNVGGQSTQIILKQGFAPPEQHISGGRLGPWSDVFALGVTIYCSVTGRMPANAMERLAGAGVPPPSGLGIALPDDFEEQALQKAMALRSEERYQDVQTFWNELTRRRDNPPRRNAVFCLLGRAGVWSGRRFFPEQMLYAGRNRSCAIYFPPDVPGVGDIHFRIWSEAGRLYLTDLGSGPATWLNYRRMTPGLVYELKAGDGIRIGDNQIFEVTIKTHNL